ncbi:MAG: hypothetical protein KAW09_12420 [Thermoplasmata archaeon]|nr:hypothetical protein [Thermoplasmata archaeon]
MNEANDNTLPTSNFREEDVRLTYRFLGHENESEIRLIDPSGKKPPKSIFVHSEDEFVKTCQEWNV